MKIDLPEDRPRLHVDLDDGGQVLLSPLVSDDRLLLVEGLTEMSVESRYSRFGQGRAKLSEAELDYLANIDLRNHVAWGAALDGEGAGVGRYIVFGDRGCAEVAVTVLDRFQRRGLGGLLFRALAAVARADGIAGFRFEFVADNEPVRRMVGELDIGLDHSGTTLVGRMSLADIPRDENEAAFVAVMEEARARLDGG